MRFSSGPGFGPVRALMILTVLSIQISSALVTATSPWAGGSHDPQNTGRSPYDSSQNTGLIRWNNTPLDDGYRSSPVITHDDVIIMANYKSLFAIEPNGRLKWQTPVTSAHYPSGPVLDSKENLYFVSLGGFYSYDINGTERWNISFPYYLGNIMVGPDDYIYIQGFYRPGRVLKFDNLGVKQWEIEDNRINGWMAFDHSGKLLFPYKENLLAAIDPSTGKRLWQIESNDTAVSTPMVTDDPELVIISGVDDTYLLSTDGELVGKMSRPTANYALGPDRKVFASSKGSIIAFDYQGQKLWDRKYSGNLAITLLADSVGNVFYPTIDPGTKQLFLYKIGVDGTLIWNKTLFKSDPWTPHVSSYPAMGRDGTYYIVVDGVLLAVNARVPYPPTQMFIQQDGQAVRLNWMSPQFDSVESKLTSYAIYRGISGQGTMKRIATIPSSKTTFKDNGVSAGRTYNYYVTAINASGESAPGDMVTIKVKSSNGFIPGPSASIIITSLTVAVLLSRVLMKKHPSNPKDRS